MTDEIKVEKEEVSKKPTRKPAKKVPKVEILSPLRDEYGRHEIGEILEFKGTAEELERLEKLGVVAKV